MALASVVFFPCVAFAEQVTCPQQIVVKESLDQSLPEAWQSTADASPRYLAGVSFFDGDPKENRSIAPTSDSRARGKDRVALWRMGSSGAPVWISCHYLDTGISISRQLPLSYRECRVTYGPGGVIRYIECK